MINKNNMNFIFFIATVVIFSCSNSRTRTSKGAISNRPILRTNMIENDSEAIENVRNMIQLADSQCKYVDSTIFTILPKKESSDPLKLTLFYQNNIPIKLEYTTFEDGGRAYGHADFYFDNQGFAFAHKLYVNDIAIVETFRNNYSVLKFSVDSQGSIKIMNLSQEVQLYRRSFARKTLDDYMQNFINIFYKGPDCSPKSPPILLTLKTVNVFNNPGKNADEIGSFDKGTNLIYLGGSNQQSKIKGHTWIWYHVKSSLGKEGWIFGYPTEVIEANDENY